MIPLKTYPALKEWLDRQGVNEFVARTMRPEPPQKEKPQALLIERSPAEGKKPQRRTP